MSYFKWSAIALPRIYAALLENNQFDDGIKLKFFTTTFDSIT